MKRWFVLFAVSMLLCVPCRAQDKQIWDELGGGELARAGERYNVGIELSPELDLDEGARSLLGRASEYLPGVVRDALRSALMLLVVVLLCAAAEGVQAAGMPGGMPVCVMAGALAITGLAANDMTVMLGLGRSTIDKMQGFGQVLLPVMAAFTAATGSVGAAAARQVATAMFSSVLLTLIDKLLVPLVYAYVTACTAYAAVGNPGLKKVADILKWIVTTSLTTLLIVFVTYLSLSGTFAGTADAAALKATKMAISNAVPVVGRIISDAAETVLIGAGLLKNTVGLFGMLAVLALCIVPFLHLGVHYLTYKISAALAATLAHGRLSELIGGIGTAFGLILGMTGACTLLLLISMLSGVVGVGT